VSIPHDGALARPSPWASPFVEVLQQLGTDAAQGLSPAEASRRLERYGPNHLQAERLVTFWSVAREEVTEPMILLLLAVGVLYGLWGEWRDALAIFVIIAGIVTIEVFNEYRAKAAIAALRHLAAPAASVVRAGQRESIAVTAVVPGDLVLLGPGERVPADVRLVEALGLRIDESGLTGESAPADKGVDPLPADTPLADRRNMAYAGSVVTAGRGQGVVIATGMDTELGRIAGLVSAAREPRTPLQLAMRQLAGWLLWLALGFSVLVPALGLLSGQDLRTMVLTGLTLAFATIPEELPILITVVLGLGALRLARRRAVVKRLRAAETLGSISTIATDKTGTITENRMVMVELWPAGNDAPVALARAAGDPGARRLLELGALANDAALSTEQALQPATPQRPVEQAPRPALRWAGDPTDVALLTAAENLGLDPLRLRAGGAVAEMTFDDRRRTMSVAYRRREHILVAAKGAPEAILAGAKRIWGPQGEQMLTAEARAQALAAAAEMAARGLRVLALAGEELPVGDGAGPTRVEHRLPASLDAEADGNLSFAGLVGLLDPPRPEATGALATLRTAGIRVLMLTGDHPATARAIAGQVGIDGGGILTGPELDALDEAGLRAAVDRVSVYARIAPEHKLRLVRALAERGEIVAVTGDGVNDAPALKEAAIGVAMGETGTDAAREAADMVLADDNLSTIAVAVREGRKLYENLRKAVRYYLAVKVALVATSLVAVLLRLPVPFAPVQIIVLELFMDLNASVAFTSEPAEGDVMARPPRNPKRPFMDRSMQLGILAGGASLGAAVLGAYLWALGRGAATAHAQTLAFATWMAGHVLLALQMRSERQPLVRAGLFSNPAMIFWGVAAVGLALIAPYVPVLGHALRLTPLRPEEWAVAVLLPLLATSWWEALKLVRWRRPATEQLEEVARAA